ncbi:MAG: hypothetical protein AABY03_00430 [Nanoarchaeota archaeon]
MPTDREKAFLMFKLAKSKGGLWGNVYDRLEHFKRFQYLKQIVKELEKIGFVIVHKKPNYIAISLNPHSKREIIEFIEKHLPEMKGILK